ncbi:MAG TPA: hypothetical protein DEB39_02730 [Planctomycetaceae bacterium]|nr:hypothetical protein [Planctomycetaceae bacterium]
MQYEHIGIPTTEEKQWAGYLEGGKVHFSDPNACTYRIEWLKFDPESPMPKELQTKTHIAFRVDDLAKAVEGRQILVEPFDVGPGRRCAFILHEGLPIEFMEVK